jgi:hypothetical protein
MYVGYTHADFLDDDWESPFVKLKT